MSTRVNSQEFTPSLRTKIGQEYVNRCSICLTTLSESGSECADILDVNGMDAKVEMAIRNGILPAGYERSAEENSIVQCASCYWGFFMPNYVAMSPPPQLLQYIFDYLVDTPVASQKDLWEVFALLSDAVDGHQVDLPDPTSVLPYIGLYTLVPLEPKELYGLQCLLPGLSIISGHHFVPAPPGTPPDAPNVARIFDAMSLTNVIPSETLGQIPFSSLHLEFGEQYYWRLPIKPIVVFLGLMARVVFLGPDCKEIMLTNAIQDLLMLSKSDVIQDFSVHRLSSSGSSGGVQVGLSGHCYRKQSPNDINTRS